MTLSAAILAGGRARRYGGRDKGALLVDGRSIRERQMTELAPLTHDILIVGSGGALQRDERESAGTRCRSVPDRVPDSGPLGGLHTALSEALFDTTVVIACDMPYVTAPLLLQLAALAQDADVAVPRTDRGCHPLCAAYRRACVEPIARRLADGRLKMVDLFEDLRVRFVGSEELARFGDVGRLLANVNSPADYQELVSLQRFQP